MARDLPYFKFYVSEWSDGDITLEEMEAQGLFINICAYYWSNECELSYEKTRKKFRHVEENVFDSLVSSGVVKLDGDFLTINFLDEQKEERGRQSNANSLAGLKSAEARRLKKAERESNGSSTEFQRPLNSRSTETQPLRREEKREEEIRVEEKKEDSTSSGSPIILPEDQILQTVLDNFSWIESLQRHFKNTDLETIQEGLKEFISELALKDELHKGYEEIKRHFFNWFKIDLAKKHKAGKFSVDVNKGLSNNTDYDELSKHDATQGWDPDKD